MKKAFLFIGIGAVALIGSVGWLFMRTKNKNTYYDN